MSKKAASTAKTAKTATAKAPSVVEHFYQMHKTDVYEWTLEELTITDGNVTNREIIKSDIRPIIVAALMEKIAK